MRYLLENRCWCLLLFALIVTASLHVVQAQETATSSSGLSGETAAQEPPAAAPAGPPSNAELKVMADTVWVLVTGMLVFFMNLGFATVESGMCRAKNCVNILSKNFIVFAVTSIGFWLLGWGIMFGNG